MFFSGSLGFLMMIIIVGLVSVALRSTRRAQSSRPVQHPGAGYQLAAPGHGRPEVPMNPATRSALDSDITEFGGELRDLDLDVVGHELSPEANTEYTRALDSYENAKQALQIATLDSDATHISQILEEGRYLVRCVKARVAGHEVPVRRPPCFFDPAHGPSVENVTWAPVGGAPREVPACALDAARVRSGAQPHVRMVQAGPGQVPYWEDRSHAAWARGYYGSWGHDPAIRGLAQGAMFMGGFSLLMGLLDD